MGAAAFYSLCISFLAGVFASSAGFLSASLLLFAGIVALGSLAYGAVESSGASRRSVLVAFASVALFSLGYLRHSTSGVANHPLDASLEQDVRLEGVICAEPERRESDQRFCFQPDDVEDRILASAPLYPERRYGDRIILEGRLGLPENFEAYEGGPTFNYVAYLEKDRVRYRVSRAKVSLVGEGEGSMVASALISLKSAFVGRIESLVPEPHSSIVVGVLLGEKGSLPRDLSDDFKRTGLTHILVLSGSNVTVVADTLMKAFSVLPRVAGLCFGAMSIVLFAIMTGASATTVRASAMALVVVLAKGAGRRYDVARALALAAVVMVAHNPRILAFDVGFQLSFLATLALVYVSPVVSSYLGFIPERFQLREIVTSSLSTQLFTLPFILHSMGEVSVVSLAPNLLVLPLVPWVMFFGFAAGAAGFVADMVALPAAWSATALVSWTIAVVERFSALSFATVRIAIGPWTLAASYIVCVFLLARLHRRRAILEAS